MSIVNPIDFNRSESLMTPIDHTANETDAANPIFVLTFDLPEYLCYWDDPIACHYEEFEETVCIGDSDSAEQPVKPFIIKIRNSTFKPEVEVGAISKLNENRKIISPTENILGTELAKSVIQTSNTNQVGLKVKDFPLNIPFTISQTHNIIRYCMPQILHSYNFPVEIKEEKSRREVAKTKNRLGLVMAHIKAQHRDKSYHTFGIERKRQNNPELFMIEWIL